MKDHVLTLSVIRSSVKEGETTAKKKWQRVDVEGSAQEGSCIVTDAPILFSSFVPMSEQATAFREGELISISVDEVEFTKRKVIAKGQLI